MNFNKKTNESDKKMDNKKFVLSDEEAKDLVWKEIMEEVEDNFTPEFQAQVIKTIMKIRELN